MTLHSVTVLVFFFVQLQSQQPLGNLDADLRRALSPETVQGGDRIVPPAAGFSLGRFQVGFRQISVFFIGKGASTIPQCNEIVFFMIRSLWPLTTRPEAFLIHPALFPLPP